MVESLQRRLGSADPKKDEAPSDAEVIAHAITESTRAANFASMCARSEDNAANRLAAQIQSLEGRGATIIASYVTISITTIGIYLVKRADQADATAQMFQMWGPLIGIIGGLMVWRMQEAATDRINEYVTEGEAYEEDHGLSTQTFRYSRITRTFWKVSYSQIFVTIGSVLWASIGIAPVIK